MIRMCAVAVLAVTLSGCGGDRKTAEVEPTATAEASASVAAAAGSPTPAPAADEYFAPMAGAVTVSNMTSNAAGASGGMISYETSNTPQAVVAHHKAAALRAGYKEAVEMTQGDARTWSGTQGPQTSFSVTAAPVGATTQVVLTRSTG